MKQFYTLLFFATLLAAGNSQTLTQSFNEPAVGDIDLNYRVDTSAYANGLPTNVTGSSCVWNYNNLVAIFPMITDSFIAPAAATGATAFPSATFVQHRDGIYTYYKSDAGAQQTQLLGGYSPSLSLTFSNTAIIASYPISYGYNLTDAVSGTFKYNSYNGACNGSITITAPGTGTLNYPNISIPNVICLRSVEILTLSTGILPFGTFNQTIYDYYMPGKKFPILSVSYTTYQLLAGTPTITTNVYGTKDYFTVSGIHDEQLDENNSYAFPNPFSNQLFIYPQNKEGNEFSFYDVNGRLVLKTASLPDGQAAGLEAGVYLLEIKNKSGKVYQKVVKQ